MIRRKTQIATAAVALCGLLAMLAPAGASAAGAPVWQISVSSYETNFPSGAGGGTQNGPTYGVLFTNAGGEATDGSPIVVEVTLPDELSFGGSYPDCKTREQIEEEEGEVPQAGAEQTVVCESTEVVGPGRSLERDIYVHVDAGVPDPTVVSGQAVVSGGGAGAAATPFETTISDSVAPFDLLPGRNGLSATPTQFDGTTSTDAGFHPDRMSIGLGFPADRESRTSEFGLETLISAIEGGVHSARFDFPRGFIVDPLATPEGERCTEAQLESYSCPNASAVGVITIRGQILGGPVPFKSALYNMVPTRGYGGVFGFNAGNVGIWVHLLGGLRPGDYAITSTSNDILSFFVAPLFGAQVQLFGDPSSPVHDGVRGSCYTEEGICEVEPHDRPLLTMPTSCRASNPMGARIDSWEHIGVFHERGAELTDGVGNTTGTDNCAALHFEPTITARPTTNVADSPSGLEFDLKVPQTESLGEVATAHLKEAVITLPEGMALNPASANGLEGCSPGQVGVDASSGVPNGNPVNCPETSRVASVEVDTPLVDHPLGGSAYIATPYENPFGSLLALYVIVEDPQTGTLIKLSGEVAADPSTGQLRTTFDNSPELPFTEFKVNFKAGPHGVLRTPSVCGEYSTTSEITPWSAPDSGPPATPKDTYAISQSPGGGECPTSVGSEPNNPAFDAGTVTPIAGAYSPMIVNLRREDGTQQFKTVTVTPPPGLIGKLAGIPYCSEAALSTAEGKGGYQELANPSCSAASQVGTVDVAAGAGPGPYWTQAKVYLTGPYKGAPLSLAIVAPAAAGPYDLGTVVVRTALNVDPESTKITAVSDPVPSILQGIPLDIRQALIHIDRPSFTLNPTSCDPMAFDGLLTSTMGQSTSLTRRFQVAECGRLGFKPKLSLRLKGGVKRGSHPALTATLTMPGGSANIASASVALPHSEFLDQAHIGTVCTRVQYAADQCPAASIYGQATAFSPLLDKPLSGPVYLRSSNNKLPDLVASLDGQIHVDLDGRIDSVKGGIRSTFEATPDAPVSKFVLQMQGQGKGLLQNSTNVCHKENRATAHFVAQNGKVSDFEPPLKPQCGGKSKKHKHKRNH